MGDIGLNNKPGIGTALLLGKDVYNIVYNAIKIGYRHIDTAVTYGNGKKIGKAIRDAIKNSLVCREELFITIKIPTSIIERVSNKKNILIKFIKKNLKKLGLKYIDLVLFHAPVIGMIRKSWSSLEDAYFALNENKRHRVGYIGVSNYNVCNLTNILDSCRIKPYTNQIELSPFLTRNRVVNFCKLNDIKITAHSSLIKGRNFNNNLLITIGEKYDSSAAQILLKWAIQKGYYIIPMTSNIIHLEENFNLKFEINDDDMLLLDNLNENYCTLDIEYFDHSDNMMENSPDTFNESLFSL